MRIKPSYLTLSKFKEGHMPNPQPPIAITLDHFNRIRENFKQHYFLSQCNSNFGGQDIRISWSSFSLAVENFIKSIQAAPDTVALRFVLCYDAQINELYLRMQVCIMIPHAYNFDVTNSAWYTISNGSIVPAGARILFDQAYLNNFYYCEADICTPAGLINLASDTGAIKFVRNLVVPWWSEIQKIYVDNGSPANAFICFAAVAQNTASPVFAHPHELAVYLRKHDGTSMLDNNEYQAEFQMKAGVGSMLCPPN